VIEQTQLIQQLLDEIERNQDLLAKGFPLGSREVLHALDIEYTYESNRIEGNTLTLRETSLVIEKGLTVAGKSLREHLEAKNHFEAVAFVRSLVAEKRPLSESLLKQIHALVLSGIDRENAGVYRSVPVLISGSRHEPPQPWLVPKLMEDLFLWLNAEGEGLHPVVRAAELHERIATIHPFVDGNGRTSRLAMNLSLLGDGYPIANLSGETAARLEYYDALERCNLEGDKGPFHRLITQKVLEYQRRLLAL